MFGVDQTLLIRALNSTRQTYFPSYVGMRLIADQLPKCDNSYLQRVVLRRLRAGDLWRFKRFKMYKGSSVTRHGIDHIYRDCLAPSPLTAFAESWILSQLARDSAFRIPPCVYSYRWPKSESSGGSYAFFADGYNERNSDVADALAMQGSVAVVTDLKGFYPSVQRAHVLNALMHRLGKSDGTSAPYRDSLLEFYSQLVSDGGGIPIGPASSHVLGHLALSDIDSEFSAKYGTSYFRYVDDLVVVCDAKDARNVEHDIQRSVERHGYSLNADKTVVLNGAEWHRNILRADVSEEDNFRRYSSDIAVYLALHPTRADSLEGILTDAGLSVPLRRLVALSSYPRFRYFLSRRKAHSGLSHALGLYFSSDKDFLDRGQRLKIAYESALDRLGDEEGGNSPNLRRWHVQRVRRVVNSLFYLRSFDEWASSQDTFDAWPELLEQRALASALATGEVNSILPFYGRGAAAFSELWSEHGNALAVVRPPERQFNEAEIDGLGTLRLYGVISAATTQPYTDGKQARLLRVLGKAEPIAREQPDLTFEDEFESLRLGVPEEKLATFSRTRYSLSEGTALEALSLLSSEYRS